MLLLGPDYMRAVYDIKSAGSGARINDSYDERWLFRMHGSSRSLSQFEVALKRLDVLALSQMLPVWSKPDISSHRQWISSTLKNTSLPSEQSVRRRVRIQHLFRERDVVITDAEIEAQPVALEEEVAKLLPQQYLYPESSHFHLKPSFLFKRARRRKPANVSSGFESPERAASLSSRSSRSFSDEEDSIASRPLHTNLLSDTSSLSSSMAAPTSLVDNDFEYETWRYEGTQRSVIWESSWTTHHCGSDEQPLAIRPIQNDEYVADEDVVDGNPAPQDEL